MSTKPETAETLSTETLKKAAKTALKARPLPDYRGGRNYPKLEGDA